MKWVRQQCPACDKFVRRCKDGRLAKHKGVNRRAEPGWRCVASGLTAAAFYADPGWSKFVQKKAARNRRVSLDSTRGHT